MPPVAVDWAVKLLLVGYGALEVGLAIREKPPEAPVGKKETGTEAPVP